MRPMITQGEIEEKISIVLERSEALLFRLETQAEFEGMTKHRYEVAKAKAIVKLRNEYEGKKITVDEKAALALLECEEEYAEYLLASAQMDGLRVEARLLANESDLLRTLAANLRPLVTPG